MEQLLRELLEAGNDDRPWHSVKQIQSSRASAKGHPQQGASLTGLDITDNASTSLTERNGVVALGRMKERANIVPTATASNRRLKKSEVRKKRRIQEVLKKIDDLLSRSDRSAIGNVTLDHTNAAPSVDIRKSPTNFAERQLSLQQLLSRSCYGCILEGNRAHHHTHSEYTDKMMKAEFGRDRSPHLSTSFKSAITSLSAIEFVSASDSLQIRTESAGVMSLTPLLVWDRATKLSNLLFPGGDLTLLLSPTRTEYWKIQMQSVDRAFLRNDLYYWKQSSTPKQEPSLIVKTAEQSNDLPDSSVESMRSESWNNPPQKEQDDPSPYQPAQALRNINAPRDPQRDEDHRKKDEKKLSSAARIPCASVPNDFFRPEKTGFSQVQAPDDFGVLKRKYVQPGAAFVAQGRGLERLYDEATSNANRDAFPRVPSDATSGGPRLASKEYTSWQSSVCSKGLIHGDSMRGQIYQKPPGDDMLTGLVRVEEVLSDDDVAFHSDSTGISLVSTVESDGEESFVSASCSPHPTTDVHSGGLPDVPLSEILRGLVQNFLPKAKTLMMQGPDSSISSVSVTSSRGETNLAPTSVSTSVTTISRRTRPRQNDSDDDSGSGRRPKRPRPTNIVIEPCSTERLLLACPHAKFNPEMYSERNTNPAQASYHKCASKILTSIARLKQHLYRVHRRPEHYCSSCYEAFNNEGDRSRHERLRTCLIIDCPFAEKMSPDQYQAIKRRKLGEDCVEAWFAIFRTLFPHARLPDDPYVESTESLLSRRILGEFIAFVEREAPQRLAQRMGMPLFGSENATTLQWHLNQVLEEALPVVLAEVQHQYQLLEMPRTRNTVPAGAD